MWGEKRPEWNRIILALVWIKRWVFKEEKGMNWEGSSELKQPLMWDEFVSNPVPKYIRLNSITLSVFGAFRLLTFSFLSVISFTSSLFIMSYLSKFPNFRLLPMPSLISPSQSWNGYLNFDSLVACYFQFSSLGHCPNSKTQEIQGLRWLMCSIRLSSVSSDQRVIQNRFVVLLLKLATTRAS